MIEALLEDVCTSCNQCVAVCPSDVFAARVDAAPIIARPDDCQTCFLCELYCPTDALFVHPDAVTRHPQDPRTLRDSGLLGDYRRDSGWDEWAENRSLRNQHWRMAEVFRRGRTA